MLLAKEQLQKLFTILLHAASAREEEQRQVHTHAQDRIVNKAAAAMRAAATAKQTGENAQELPSSIH